MRALLMVATCLAASSCSTLAANRFDPARVIGVAAGFVAHELCGGVFTAGLDPGPLFSEAIAPVMGPAASLASYEIDSTNHRVIARIAGLGPAIAQWRAGAGCVMLNGPQIDRADIGLSRTSLAPPTIAGSEAVAAASPALATAIDRAFAETTFPPHRFTKAVVIVHNGKIIAERYAPGYGVDTPIHGWSMTKSVTNALLGILVRQNKINMHAPAPVRAWTAADDPRHAITPDQLLRMESGLDTGQSLTAGVSDTFNPASQMLYDEPDMGAFAEAAPLLRPPGEKWNYTNGDTQILSAIIRNQVGGDGASVREFVNRELFGPLGMEHSTLELDGAGSPVGSSMMWASPRDWARLGLLYLNDGTVGGRRILPVGWADYSARASANADWAGYGAGFWTNRDEGPGARRRKEHGMPADSYIARGSQGQYVVIVPSKNLIVVRMGYAHNALDDVDAVAHLVGEIVAMVDSGKPM